jgi:hypothetical protein
MFRSQVDAHFARVGIVSIYVNGALSAASGLHMNAVIYYDLIVFYLSFLYISGDLDGPVINNEIPSWSTRAANITLVTKSDRDVIEVADASLRKAMGAYDNIDFEIRVTKHCRGQLHASRDL